MANFDTLRTDIQANIKTNGNQEITGAVLQDTLLDMVDTTEEGITELLKELTQYDCIINGGKTLDLSLYPASIRRIYNAVWADKSIWKHKVIPTSDMYSSIVLNIGDNSYSYAFLKSYDNENVIGENPSLPDFATGYTDAVTSSEKIEVDVPFDAKYLYIGSSYINEGTTINVEPIISDNYGEGIIAELDNFKTQINAELNQKQELVDYSQLTHYNGIIDSTAAAGWALRSMTLHYIIPISPLNEISLTNLSNNEANNNAYGGYCFLKELPTYEGVRPVSYPVFASGYSNRIVIPVGAKINVTAPEDARYLYVSAITSDVLPIVIIKGGIISRIDQIESKLPIDGTIPYFGEPIKIQRYSCNIETYMTAWVSGFAAQGGAIYGDFLFICSANGIVWVYSIENKSLITSFYLDNYETITPHCNSVFFGEKYESADEFPVLYVNAYNNTELPKGTLYGYRLSYLNGVFTSQMVQTIQIGFTSDAIWTDGAGDVRPYGNFAYDTITKKLIAFTILDTTRVTRFFSFTMPSVSESSVILQKTDVLGYFDTQYIEIPQDASCYDGKIYIVSGYHTSDVKAHLRVIDITMQCVTSAINLYDNGFAVEPEYVDIYNGKILFGNNYTYLIHP